MNASTQQLSDAGVSIWLDDLSRERIKNGELQELIDNLNVVGVTTNPSIFAAALAKNTTDGAYGAQLKELAAQCVPVDEAIFEITTDDVRQACSIFDPTYQKTSGVDGRVSIEVDPHLARNAKGTIAQARKLYQKVDRKNVMIKIPATEEGLEAIAETLAHGISVNVTLIFSLERYRAVINAFMIGLEQAQEHGHDLSSISSVASFFVSRVDTEIDTRLEKIGTEEALALRGKAGVANARLAYQIFGQSQCTERWRSLEAAGARVQRPLWASTGVKNPHYPETLYVTEIVAHDTVNTMPEKTLHAAAAYGAINDSSLATHYAEASQTLDKLDALGISYAEVVGLLEEEGIKKFNDAWSELTHDVEKALKEHQ